MPAPRDAQIFAGSLVQCRVPRGLAKYSESRASGRTSGTVARRLIVSQHPPLHDEVRRLAKQEAQRREEDVLNPVAAATRPHDEAGASLPLRHEHECSPLLEKEEPSRLGAGNAPAEAPIEPEPSLLRRVDGIAGFDPLPFGMDPIGVSDVKTEQILQPSVAVETAVVLPELCEPRPHGLRRSVDRYRMLNHVPRNELQLVAGECLAQLSIGQPHRMCQGLASTSMVSAVIKSAAAISSIYMGLGGDPAPGRTTMATRTARSMSSPGTANGLGHPTTKERRRPGDAYRREVPPSAEGSCTKEATSRGEEPCQGRSPGDRREPLKLRGCPHSSERVRQAVQDEKHAGGARPPRC